MAGGLSEVQYKDNFVIPFQQVVCLLAGSFLLTLICMQIELNTYTENSLQMRPQ